MTAAATNRHVPEQQQRAGVVQIERHQGLYLKVEPDSRMRSEVQR